MIALPSPGRAIWTATIFAAIAPTWLAITNWPAIISGSVGYEWCTQGSMLPDGCNSTLLDFFSIPNPAPSGIRSSPEPEGGIKVAMNQSGNIRGFGISSCYDASGLPYMVGSRFRLTGYATAATNIQHAVDTAVAGDQILARSNAYVGDTDLDGRPSIQGGTVDIGAYEFQPGVSGEFIGWLSGYACPLTARLITQMPTTTGRTTGRNGSLGPCQPMPHPSLFSGQINRFL